MKNQKQKSTYGEPFAWNPQIVWHLLRRNEQYQCAFKKFLGTCDERAREIVEAISDELIEFELHEGKVLRKIERSSRADKLLATGNTRDQRGGADPEGWFDRLCVEMLTIKGPAIEEFLEAYGYILNFPLEPNAKRPNPFFLDRIWKLFPAKIHSSTHVSPPNLLIEINPLFSTNTISESIRALPQLGAPSRFASPQKIDWEDVEIYGEAYVMKRAGRKRAEIASELKRLFPGRIEQKSDLGKSASGWADQFEIWLTLFDPLSLG